MTVHLPSVSFREGSPQDVKPHIRITYPSRDSLKLPEVQEAIQQELATFLLPHPEWSVDEHKRLLTKVFQVLWFKHGLAAPRVPRSPWITADVWEILQQHAVARAAHAGTAKMLQKS